MHAQRGLLFAALAVLVAAPVVAQTPAPDDSLPQAPSQQADGLPDVAALEQMLVQVDDLIAKQDRQIAAMDDRILATDDPLERLRLEDIVYKWTGVLDALEEQRQLLTEILSTSQALRDEGKPDEEDRP